MSSPEILTTIHAAQAEGLDLEAIEGRVWKQHGTTCAVLALDSTGMTRTTLKSGIVHFLIQYKQMKELAGEILEAHGCLGWRSFADNLFAEFVSVEQAVDAGLEIHRQVEARGVMLDEQERYRVSLGIGYGELLTNGAAGVMGHEMNVAAKLAEDIAGVGETLLSEAAYRDLIRRRPLEVHALEQVISQVPLVYYRLKSPC